MRESVSSSKYQAHLYVRNFVWVHAEGVCVCCAYPAYPVFDPRTHATSLGPSFSSRRSSDLDMFRTAWNYEERKERKKTIFRQQGNMHRHGWPLPPPLQSLLYTSMQGMKGFSALALAAAGAQRARVWPGLKIGQKFCFLLLLLLAILSFNLQSCPKSRLQGLHDRIRCSA